MSRSKRLVPLIQAIKHPWSTSRIIIIVYFILHNVIALFGPVSVRPVDSVIPACRKQKPLGWTWALIDGESTPDQRSDNAWNSNLMRYLVWTLWAQCLPSTRSVDWVSQQSPTTFQPRQHAAQRGHPPQPDAELLIRHPPVTTEHVRRTASDLQHASYLKASDTTGRTVVVSRRIVLKLPFSTSHLLPLHTTRHRRALSWGPAVEQCRLTRIVR